VGAAFLLVVPLALAVGNAERKSVQILPPRVQTRFSADRAFSLCVTPTKDFPRAKGNCLAELKARKGEKAGQVLWRGKLLNEWAPRRALVAGDGRHVVTIDDWLHGGRQHALVIYGPEGKLVRDLELSDLLQPDEIKHLERGKLGLEWTGGAKFRFSRDHKVLFIRCGWGKLKVIDLATGAVQGKQGKDHDRLLRQFELLPDEALGAAGLLGLAVGDLVVPAPDPANPVDYVEWWNRANSEGVADEDNAAPLLDEAMERLTDLGACSDFLKEAFDGGFDWDSEQGAMLAQWFEQNADALELFRQASEKPACARQYSAGDSGALVAVQLPQLSRLRNACKAMAARSNWYASQGRYAAAAEDLLTVARVGQLQPQAPSLIECLVGTAVQSLAYDRMARLASDAGDALDYGLLAERLAHDDAGAPPFARAIVAEKAMLMDTSQRVFRPNPETGQPALDVGQLGQLVPIPDDAVRESGSSAQAMPQFDYTVRVGSEYYDRLTAVMELPYPQAQPQMAQLQVDFAAESNPLLRLLMVAGSKVKETQTRLESQRRMTHTLVRVLAYRQQTGALPESLDDLPDAGHVTADAFTEQPFVYRRDGDLFTLYSVGPNGQDDGGAHTKWREDGDFVIWPPP